jgi:hypothetical protein
MRETSTSFCSTLRSLEIEDYSTLSGQPLGILEPSFKSKLDGTYFARVDVDLNPIDEPLDLRVKVYQGSTVTYVKGYNATPTFYSFITWH